MFCLVCTQRRPFLRRVTWLQSASLYGLPYLWGRLFRMDAKTSSRYRYPNSNSIPPVDAKLRWRKVVLPHSTLKWVRSTPTASRKSMWVRRGNADDTDDLQAIHILKRLETWSTAEMSISLSYLSAYRSFAVRELHIVFTFYPERRMKLHSALNFFVSYLCQHGRRLVFLCNLVKVYSPLLWYKGWSNSAMDPHQAFL